MVNIAPPPSTINVSEIVPGHFVTRTAAMPPPLVLASPHSGRAYPSAFARASALDLMGLRRAEDAWVDELAAPAAALGVPLIAARWGRAFIDLNRAPEEIDAALLEDPAAAGVVKATERVRSGLGVLPRLTGPGLHIYREKIAARDALQRIAAVHAPYHQRLAALIDGAAAAHGYALLVDCHSMPPLPIAHRGRPRFVIGDAAGATAPEAVVRWIEAYLRRAGHHTARNAPYSGGYTTRFHAARARRRFAVQIEIDRSLYMDVETLERHAGFAAIAELLTGMVEGLLGWLPETYGGALPGAIAAE